MGAQNGDRYSKVVASTGLTLHIKNFKRCDYNKCRWPQNVNYNYFIPGRPRGQRERAKWGRVRRGTRRSSWGYPFFSPQIVFHWQCILFWENLLGLFHVTVTSFRSIDNLFYTNAHLIRFAVGTLGTWGTCLEHLHISLKWHLRRLS